MGFKGQHNQAPCSQHCPLPCRTWVCKQCWCFFYCREYIDSGSAGGGVNFFEGNTADFQNCIFTNNSAHDWGGAVAIQNSVRVVLKACTFENNTSHEGAALYSNNGTQLKLEINNCTFTGNEASLSGGALFINVTSAFVSQSHFVGNSAPYGSAASFFGDTCDLEIIHCSLIRNKLNGSQNKYKGAIFVDRAGEVYLSCVFFIGNAANFGGALTLGRARARIDNCTFNQNEAYYDGGSILAYDSHYIIVTNSSFSNNEGNAINTQNTPTIIQQCDFVNNGQTVLGSTICLSSTANLLLRLYGTNFIDTLQPEILVIGSNSTKATLYIKDNTPEVDEEKLYPATPNGSVVSVPLLKLKSVPTTVISSQFASSQCQSLSVFVSICF